MQQNLIHQHIHYGSLDAITIYSVISSAYFQKLINLQVHVDASTGKKCWSYKQTPRSLAEQCELFHVLDAPEPTDGHRRKNIDEVCFPRLWYFCGWHIIWIC